MSSTESVLLLLGVMSTCSSLLVLYQPNPVKSGFFLMAVFVLTASLWFGLNAQSLAVMLLLIYVGDRKSVV